MTAEWVARRYTPQFSEQHFSSRQVVATMLVVMDILAWTDVNVQHRLRFDFDICKNSLQKRNFMVFMDYAFVKEGF